MDDCYARQGSRWVTNHSKRTECKAAHKERLAEFKQALTTRVETPPTPAPQSDVGALWAKLRSVPRYAARLKEIETVCKTDHDDDSEAEGEFVFDPAVGIEDLIKGCLGAEREIVRKKEELKAMESEHDATLIDMRDEMRELQRQVQLLTLNAKDHTYQLSEMRTRVGLLERTNGIYRDRMGLSEDPTE